jgi:hypothetical protein
MDPVEERAARILSAVPEWLWDGETLPVPIEDIADSVYGLLIRDVEDMSAAPGAPPLAPGQSLSGLLLGARGEIWVNAEEAKQWPPRRRFTIGHELGHWALHQDEQTALFCRHGSVDPEDKNDRPPIDPIEEQANWFAASILMPAGLIRAHYERTGGNFAALCAIFKCSGAAMGRRLHQVIPRQTG